MANDDYEWKKYDYEPLAVVMRENSPALVATVIEKHGCYGFDRFQRFQKLTGAELDKVLDLVAEFCKNDMELTQVMHDEASGEQWVEQSPDRMMLDAPSAHPAWNYGWPYDKLPKFTDHSEQVGAEKNSINDGDWRRKAKNEADRIALEHYNTGIRQITARSICNDVAEALEKDESTHGLQGPRSSSNVRVEGLRGWKFIPPKTVK